jgi:phosphomevalonate kinase
VRVLAPGKLVLTGAYAVLEGAPAIVAAVDRYASAAVAAPREVETCSLHDEAGRKLGLGSSAASMVVTEAAMAAARGLDLRDAAVRAAIFRAVRSGHARSQGGGSGVDVAAAVHGGILRYAISGGGADASVKPVELPRGLAFAAFWSGTSARTSELRARVDALGELARRPLFAALHATSVAAAGAVEVGDLAVFVDAAQQFGRSLESLGRAADAPIVPPAFAELAALASDEQAAFYPSGAGGGDVGVWLGSSAPSASFLARAASLSMSRLALGFDRGGVRLDSTSP